MPAEYHCRSDLQFDEVANLSQKGIAVDDTTFKGCSEKIPLSWPNTGASLGSLRLFKAWDPSWPEEERLEAWGALKGFVEKNEAKILMGTQVTCNETDDDRDWAWVLELLELLGPKHVMALAVGNEMELLQFKPPDVVPRACAQQIWSGGYFYRKLTERVKSLNELKGFQDVLLTSVFGGYIIAGNPFVDTPMAKVLSFLQNVTDDYGDRWVFTLNVYPYFDPGNRLDPNSTSGCSSALEKSLCFDGPGCLLPSITSTMRRSMEKLTGTKSGKLWLGETGWSYPQASTLPGANAQMAKCKNFSSELAFRTYYQNFLKWNLSIGTDERGPDHVFYFTLRDSVNFGVGEHFGLIESCDSESCKLEDDHDVRVLV